jgi:hypothetical protein
MGLLGEVGLHELVPQPSEVSFEAWWHLSSQQVQVQGQHRHSFNSLVILGANRSSGSIEIVVYFREGFSLCDNGSPSS